MGSIRSPLGDLTTLALANDLDGTDALSVDLDLTGSAGAVVFTQIGTAGTAGIDTLKISKDGGATFAAATIRDSDGDAVTTGILNAAGVEGVTPAACVFTIHPKDGQLNGPTILRCERTTAWVTGAPSVLAVRIG
jgi:hypothetical protein